MSNVYSLHDMKAGGFYAPFCAPNHAAAFRSVATAAHMDNTIVSQHPSDFELFHIGNFDDQSGSLVPCTPAPLALVADLVEQMIAQLPSVSRIRSLKDA